jgi:hypothetical protein
MTPEEAKDARIAGGPGRPKTRLTNEDAMRMTAEGGASALRLLLYDVTKESRKSKPSPVKLQYFYVRALALKLLTQIEKVTAETLREEINQLSKEVETESNQKDEGAWPEKKENKFKFDLDVIEETK